MRYFWVAFTLCVTILISGCLGNAKSDSSQKTKSTEQQNSFGITQSSASAFSAWYHESLGICATTEDDVLNYQVPVKVDIWDRIREGFSLPDSPNKRIQQEINWYARHPQYLPRVTERGSPYLFYITEELERRKLPFELALLPIVESAYDPFAYSHGRASGMWQVIPGTGKMLGLKQNWWYDGRRDVVASTHAALNYLEALNKEFDGDWMLALAAYNSGAGNVRKAIRKNKKKNKPTDFWALKLPKETRMYVPRLLALKALVNNPDQYNIALHSTQNEPYFEIVELDSQIDLARAADLAGISMEEFYRLNPGFNRWATDPNGPHRLLLPRHCVETFKKELADLPKSERIVWDTYEIQTGDALLTIAKKFNTSVDVIQSVNGIRGNRIRAGKTILVPRASEDPQHYSMSNTQRTEKKQNNGSGEKQTYVVRSGDSFWTIARKFGVSHRQVAKWNNLAPGDPIRPGQALVIWTTKKLDSTALIDLPEINHAPPGAVRKVTYRVRNGDSLARIADKFNVSLKQLLKWNNVNPNKYLQPGDRLTLYVDVTKIES